MAYILESYNKNYPKGDIIISEMNELFCSKGFVERMHTVNVKTRESDDPCKTIGLGYVNVEDEDDFNRRFKEIATRKIKEVVEPYKKEKGNT